MAAPIHTMRIKNGLKSNPVDGRLIVDGRIDGTDKGYLDFHVENDTRNIRFRGTILEFAEHWSGQGSLWIGTDGNMVAYRANEVDGYDTRVDGPSSSSPTDPGKTPSHRPDAEPIERGPNVETNTVAGEGPFTYTTGPFVRYIDPVDGDDSWPGTRTDPLKTIQEFVDRMPMMGLHTVQGITEKGTYHEGSIHWPHPTFKCFGSSRDEFFYIGPNCEPGTLSMREVEDHQVNARQTNTQIYPYSTFNEMGFHDLFFKGAIQNRWGTVGLRNCVFEPVPMGPPGSSSRMSRAYDCYGGMGFLVDCHLKTLNEPGVAQHFVNSSQQGRVALRRCSAGAVGALDSVVNLQGSDRRNIYDEGGNALGKFEGWFR